MSDTATSTPLSHERIGHASAGWSMIGINLILYLAAISCLALFIVAKAPVLVAGFILILLGSIFVSAGFFTLKPNQSAVLTLFGAYKGTVRREGFSWTNPLVQKTKISVRARNLDGEKLKVNDRAGNPIEIAVVVVWRVKDTAQASFDVDNYEHYVKVQSESAVRHLAREYYYDGEEHDVTLRGSSDEIVDNLKAELHERLSKAGVVIDEARITHLAYAQEIAQTMLRRQQAEAVIAARQKIVQGAVGMVEMALEELSAKNVLVLDDERRASMVTNLLVVLCGESEAKPVINTGTLYH